MVAGRLQEKNGFYYIVLSYTDSAGKRRQPWIGTGLPVKGNKKRAEKMLADTRKDFTIPKGQVSELSPDMAFSDYMRYWLKMMRTAVTETTYSSYCFNVQKHIIPYFEPLGVTLAGLQPRQIQSFYLHEAETLKNTSILRFHANLHKALKYAVRIDLIASNPVDKVDRPKPQAFMASYYSAEEMEKLFEAAQGHKLELIIQLAAFYGLRRAEVMGLRWEAIDFEAKTLTIRHIVTSTRIDGKKILVEADRAKTKSSLRTLPLVDPIAERLKAVKEQQEYNQKICGNCYNQEYLGYVFVDAMGNLIQPDSVTTGFPQLLKEKGLRRIRFHDLRHTFATRALERGMDYKTLSAILGHYSVAFTMDTYVHSMDEHKRREMDKMDDMFEMRYSISVENQPYPVLCTLSAGGCTAHVPDVPKIATQTATLEAALLEVKQQIQKALRQYKNPPIPTKQEQIVVPSNSVLVLVKAG